MVAMNRAYKEKSERYEEQMAAPNPDEFVSTQCEPTSQPQLNNSCLITAGPYEING